MPTESQIRVVLTENYCVYAIPLFDAIVARSTVDAEYRIHFENWLTEGGTVLLRDELCGPFKNAEFITGQVDLKYPLHDNWTAIDSAHLHACDIDSSRANCAPS